MLIIVFMTIMLILLILKFKNKSFDNDSYGKYKKIKYKQLRVKNRWRIIEYIKRILDNINFFFVYIIIFNLILLFYDYLIKNELEFHEDNKFIFCILLLLIFIYFIYRKIRIYLSKSLYKKQKEFDYLEKKKVILMNDFLSEYFGNKSDIIKMELYKYYENENKEDKKNFYKVKKNYKLQKKKLLKLREINEYNVKNYYNIKNFKWCGICNYKMINILEDKKVFFKINRINHNFNDICYNNCIKKFFQMIN